MRLQVIGDFVKEYVTSCRQVVMWLPGLFLIRGVVSSPPPFSCSQIVADMFVTVFYLSLLTHSGRFLKNVQAARIAQIQTFILPTSLFTLVCLWVEQSETLLFTSCRFLYCNSSVSTSNLFPRRQRDVWVQVGNRPRHGQPNHALVPAEEPRGPNGVHPQRIRRNCWTLPVSDRSVAKSVLSSNPKVVSEWQQHLLLCC